jgi:hypothetical protein
MFGSSRDLRVYYFIDVRRFVLRKLMKILNRDCNLKFEVVMVFQYFVVFAAECANIMVLAVNIVTDTTFPRALQIQVRSHHIHHLTQVPIPHVSNWWY